jgi:hypothetical protein
LARKELAHIKLLKFVTAWAGNRDFFQKRTSFVREIARQREKAVSLNFRLLLGTKVTLCFTEEMETEPRKTMHMDR